MSRLELRAAGFAHRAGVERRWLVREVDLVIGASGDAAGSGAVLALVGPNGAGKSTVLRLMAGVWEPSEGEVILDGQALATLPRRRVAARIAYVPQSSSIALDFTVLDLVAMGRYLHRGRLGGERDADRVAVDRAMRRADVQALASRSVTQLSGGELQRVLIARSLATEADMLLLDEPTANLDIAHALDVMSLCRTLAADGHQVVMAMHDLNLARRHAQRIVVLDRGRIDAVGPPLEVLTRERLERVFEVAVVGPIDDLGRALHFEPVTSRDPR